MKDRTEPVEQPDPLSGRVDVLEIDPEEDQKPEPPNTAALDRYWNNANKKERKAFIKWIETCVMDSIGHTVGSE